MRELGQSKGAGQGSGAKMALVKGTASSRTVRQESNFGCLGLWGVRYLGRALECGLVDGNRARSLDAEVSKGKSYEEQYSFPSVMGSSMRNWNQIPPDGSCWSLISVP
jgi:hypothetical protein